MSQKESKGMSIGFLGALTILFIGLKLTRHIEWSWWWVLSPSLFPFAVVFAVIVCAGLLAVISGWLSS